MEKPRIIAYCALHYGVEYLKEAIQAISPYVEKVIILYSPTPSYGFNATTVCPDSEEGLRMVAHIASNKAEWHNIVAYNEGQHRGLIYRIADREGFDGILVFDADEVFEQVDIPSMIEFCNSSEARYYGIDGYINFWKSFNHACYDGFRPIRYINLHKKEGQMDVKQRIYHFSTAQRMDIMRYKLEIHGHKNEIRKGWLEMYENWKPGDVVDKGLHLVSFDLWNAVEFDKNSLPLALKEHINFNKEVI